MRTYNAPVLVVEEMFLVLLVVFVNSTGVVRLNNSLALSSDDGVLLQCKECVSNVLGNY